MLANENLRQYSLRNYEVTYLKNNWSFRIIFFVSSDVKWTLVKMLIFNGKFGCCNGTSAKVFYIAANKEY